MAGKCANCGAPLPEDQPAGHQYCARCAAAWQAGQARRQKGAGVEQDAAPPSEGRCANCGTPLPPDQPAGHQYCAKCAAKWHAGNAARERSDR